MSHNNSLFIKCAELEDFSLLSQAIPDIDFVPGVYCILNKSNGKMYIGCGMDLGKRIQTHMATLRNGWHNGFMMGHDYVVGGYENFIAFCIEKIEGAKDITDLKIKEAQYMAMVPYSNLYNRAVPYSKIDDVAFKSKKRRHGFLWKYQNGYMPQYRTGYPPIENSSYQKPPKKYWKKYLCDN